LVEKSTNNTREEDDFGGGASESDNNDARSICTIIPHELERVEEGDEEDEERWSR
jgi:hypothetical protein